MAIKAARVSEFGGRSLNVADDHANIFTDLHTDPDAKRVKAWYDNKAALGGDFLSEVRSLTIKP